jgi:hypothetical protein
MKNKNTIFHPIKLIGALVFLMAFTLNIQTSLNGEWDLVNVGFAQDVTVSTGGGSCFARYLSQCPEYPGGSGGGERVDCAYTGVSVPGDTCTRIRCNQSTSTLTCSDL